MRWYRQPHLPGDPEWQESDAAYADHLRVLRPRLPPPIVALASEPAFHLSGGRIAEMTMNTRSQTIGLSVDVGDAQVGYRRAHIHFSAATIQPDDLRLTADAIGATFRPNHWHPRATSEVLATEVDLAGDRYVLRVRLWPFHEFELEFAAITMSHEELEARPPVRPGQFVVAIRG
jgi:hypothetical protein